MIARRACIAYRARLRKAVFIAKAFTYGLNCLSENYLFQSESRRDG